MDTDGGEVPGLRPDDRCDALKYVAVTVAPSQPLIGSNNQSAR